MRSSLRMVLFLCAGLGACAPTVGNGTAQTEAREVDRYDGITVEGGIRVEAIAGTPQRLDVTADANLLELIDTFVEDGALMVRPSSGIDPVVPPEVDVGTDALAFASARQSGSVILVHRVAAQRFAVVASEGAAAEAGGACEELRAIASGNGAVNATAMTCTNGRVDAQGGSRIEVTVTGRVEVRASGESEIIVHGSPTEVLEFLTDNSTLQIVMD